MKIPETKWTQLANLLKARLLAKYEPETLVPEAGDISSVLDIPHRGFYISVYGSGNDKLARVGFLQKGCSNVLDSAMKALQGMHTELEAKGISNKKLLTSSYNFAAIWDLVFIENALTWDANVDGIYFSWGDRYKGMYLPYEIGQMATTKPEILNRVCSWEAGVPSNLWRLPEGMVFKILADSYSI